MGGCNVKHCYCIGCASKSPSTEHGASRKLLPAFQVLFFIWGMLSHSISLILAQQRVTFTAATSFWHEGTQKAERAAYPQRYFRTYALPLWEKDNTKVHGLHPGLGYPRIPLRTARLCGTKRDGRLATRCRPPLRQGRAERGPRGLPRSLLLS